MNDIRVSKLAELLVKYSVAVKKGDKVKIRGDYAAAPLVQAVYAEVLKAGGHPMVFLEPEGLAEILYKYASEEQLKFIHEPEKIITDKYDVAITLGGTTNTKALSKIDPSRMVIRQQARTGLMNTQMRRSATGEFRWTYAIFPTSAYAQDAEMSLSDYEDFVFNACLPDLNDPVGYWQRFSKRQEKIIEWLKGKKMRIYSGGGHGIDAEYRRAPFY